MALGAPNFSIKKGDDSPALTSTLLDGNGDAVNLTGATVRFYMTKRGEDTPTVSGTATIDDDETSGIVTYPWGEGDTDTAGDYEAEWEVEFAGGEIQTFPNSGFIHIRILRDLSDEVSA